MNFEKYVPNAGLNFAEPEIMGSKEAIVIWLV
jgi:hypothetical protein